MSSARWSAAHSSPRPSNNVFDSGPPAAQAALTHKVKALLYLPVMVACWFHTGPPRRGDVVVDCLFKATTKTDSDSEAEVSSSVLHCAQEEMELLY